MENKEDYKQQRFEILENIKEMVNIGRIENAKEIIKHYDEIIKNDIEIISIKSIINIIENNYDNAEMLLNEGLEIEPENIDILYNKAYILYEKNNYIWSEKYFRQIKNLSKDEEVIKEVDSFLKKIEINKNKLVVNKKNKILVGSPINQDKEILEAFLIEIKKLNVNDYEIEYFFIDDNNCPKSSELLNTFNLENENVCIYNSNEKDIYEKNENTHIWKEKLIWKVAKFKNMMIRKALEYDFDYLFFIDSDILMHKEALNELIKSNKEIVSNIFWTKWTNKSKLMPQVWIKDQYTIYESHREEVMTQENIIKRESEFINKLKKDGIYEVGGLGACTLISKSALRKGINFNKIDNISFWGEDRHFCIRANAIGIKLFVNTVYPAYHIYRKSDLDGIELFKNNYYKFKKNTLSNRKKITLSMCINNEADRYLREVLEHAYKYVDNAVIIDDGSTDNSIEICKDVFREKPIKIVENNKTMFNNEVELRKKQWEETISTNPEWILCLDADEIFENKILEEIDSLTNQDYVNTYYFRLYDFWDDYRYRDDNLWNAHNRYMPFLTKYNKNFNYEWTNSRQHCGRLPNNLTKLSYTTSELRLKHLGWAKYEDRIQKYERYKNLDPDGIYGIVEQYESILDEEPNLNIFIEDENHYKEYLKKENISRFININDSKIEELLLKIPKEWWSRFYEYKWASQFIEADDICLDAACGIEHPLKFYLYGKCKETYAIDLDERIKDKQLIIEEVKKTLGDMEAKKVENIIDKIDLRYGSITETKYENNKFNKIFCISVLEHLDINSMKLALLEFGRILKDDGTIVLTIDYPSVDLDLFKEIIEQVGLKFVDDVDFNINNNCIFNEQYNLYCVRILLCKNLKLDKMQKLNDIREIILKNKIIENGDMFLRRFELYMEMFDMKYWLDHHELNYFINNLMEYDNILNFGFGSGHMDIILGRLGKRIEGIDLSVTGKEIGEYLLSYESDDVKERVKFIVGDICSDILKEKKYDFIWSTHVFEHIENPKCIIESLSRVVNKGTMMLVSVPYGYSYDDPDHVNHFINEIELENYFKEYIHVQHIEVDLKYNTLKAYLKF